MFPKELRYMPSHEWARLEGDVVTIGISHHAAKELGDLVYIELPDIGRALAVEEACAIVESVKAASDVFAPIAGEVIAVNEALADKPEAVNEDAYAAWLFRVKPADPAAAGKLLDAAAYTATLGAE